jgi:hypothetical protein
VVPVRYKADTLNIGIYDGLDIFRKSPVMWNIALDFCVQTEHDIMGKLIKAAVVQAEPEWLDLEGSVKKACKIIAEAASNSAEIVAFPEMWIPGYPTWIW